MTSPKQAKLNAKQLIKSSRKSWHKKMPKIVGKKFGRKRDQRKALLRSLARALVLHGRISTTEAKAKELRTFIEPIITKSKIESVQTIRFLGRFFGEDVSRKLISDIGPKYKDRNGGYTRITKRNPRKTDSAKLAVIEFV